MEEDEINDQGSESLPSGVAELLETEAANKKAKDDVSWCDLMAGVNPSFELRPKHGFIIDHEFQPHRWMADGLEVLSSARGTITLSDLKQHQPVFWQAYLPYAVFQMGTELFLKGMWLCQHADCRQLDHFGHLDTRRRQEISKALRSLGHDLFGLIETVRGIPQYQSSSQLIRFLQIVESVTRSFYYPVWKTGDRDWPSSRYPKRFYDDTQRKGAADSLKNYPEHWTIVKLFQDAEALIDVRWGLREGLASKRNSRSKVG